MIDPKWLIEARKHVGLREVPGPGFNAKIKAFWASLSGGLWYWKKFGEDDSKLPWCGAFCAYVFQFVGISPPSNYASARAWLSWGTALAAPAVGCIVVLGREGGGHVFIASARDRTGRIIGIGGNQGDSVSLAAFDSARVLGYRWPPKQPMPVPGLPLMELSKASSTGEA